MDLKSDGIIRIILILGIIKACATEAVLDDFQEDIAPYPELEIARGEEPSADYADIRDVYVVTTEGNPDYVEFVQEVFDDSLKTDGYIYVKVPGLPVQRVNENDGLGIAALSGSTDGTTRTPFEEMADVLSKGEARYHIILLVGNLNVTVDDQGLDMLQALMHDTKARIDVLAMDNDSEPVHESGSRQKRQTNIKGINVYQAIAQASGGMVIQANKNNILSVANLLKQSIKSNPVDVMRFQYPKHSGGHFNIPVDDTMSQMTLQIQAPNAPPIVQLSRPTRIPVPPTAQQVLGNSLVLFEMNMTKPTDYGQWKTLKLGISDWDVKVTGQSPVDFTSELMQPGPGGFGMYPIKGRPIAGKTYQITIKVPSYDKVKSINVVMLLDNHNMPTGMPQILHNVGGRRGKSMYTVNITIPTVDFKVAIDGMDNSKHQLRRLNPILISPISVDLTVPSMTGAKLYVNEALDIPFTVFNEASKQQEVLIKIEDDHKFAQSPVFLFYTLKGGENRTAHFTIQAGSVAGITSVVTITAKPYIKGQVTQGQYRIRRFIVEERPKKKTNDTTDPTCNVTSVTGMCKIGSDLCACVNHTWSMEVMVGDVGDGIENIFDSGTGPKGTFHNDSYTKGDKGPIKAIISDDCCHQAATIQVVDKNGNLGQCSPNITQNFTAPDLSVCNKTSINSTIGCQNTKQTGKCNFGADPCACHSVYWDITTEFNKTNNISLNQTSINSTIGCQNVKQTGKCNFGADPCACHSMYWDITTEFNKTNNISLNQVYTKGAGSNASITHSGQNVALRLDCCQQDITIIGTDLAGNMGECNITLNNYSGPKPSDCTSTSSTSTTTTTATTATSGKSSGTASSGTATTKAGATTKPGGTQTPGGGKTTGSGKTPGGSSSSSSSGSATGTHAPGSTGTKSPQSGGTTAASAVVKVSDNNNSGVPEAAVAAGMTIGAIGALSALLVMAVLFRQAAGKAAKGVEPQGRSRRNSYDRRDSAWS